MRFCLNALAIIFLSCGSLSTGYQCNESYKARFLENCVKNCSQLDWCVPECEKLAENKYCYKKPN